MSLDAPLAAESRPPLVARRDRGAGAPLLLAFIRQLFFEHLVLGWRGVRFRSDDEAAVRSAYSAMSVEEFAGINARQRWANWRTIPRNLQGRLPARPLVALDLCCGAGDSTEVLAQCLPVGSRILGLDASPALVGAARARRYPDAEGRACRVRFGVQSVLEAFRWPDGRQAEDDEMDVVNSSGAVGCHFDAKATRHLLLEVRRVLGPGGLALIDAGPGGTTPRELESIVSELGFELCGRARSCIVDRYWQYCCRPIAGAAR